MNIVGLSVSELATTATRLPPADASAVARNKRTRSGRSSRIIGGKVTRETAGRRKAYSGWAAGKNMTAMPAIPQAVTAAMTADRIHAREARRTRESSLPQRERKK